MYSHFCATSTNDYELVGLYQYLNNKKDIEYEYDKKQTIYNFTRNGNVHKKLKNIGEHLKWDDTTLHFFDPISLKFTYDFDLINFIHKKLPNLYSYIIDTKSYKCKFGVSRKIRYNYVENKENIYYYKDAFGNDQDVIRSSAILCMIRKLMFLGKLKEYEDILVIPGRIAEKYVKVCNIGIENILNFSGSSKRYLTRENSPRIGINTIVANDHYKVLKRTPEFKFALNFYTLLKNI